MNTLDKQYQELLQDILDNGVRKGDRTGTGTISVFGRTMRHDMSEGFPLLTTKKMYWKGIVTELLWFLRGGTDLRWLLEHGNRIWVGDCYKVYKTYCEKNKEFMMDKWFNNGELYTENGFIDKILHDDEFNAEWGDLGKVYGFQWRNFGGNRIENGGVVFGYDQIQNIIHTLETNPDSRRMVVSAWNPCDLENMVLPPCFTEDTLIATITGEYKKISNITTGDIVLTENGDFHEVYNLMETKYNGDIYEITTHASPYPIECTKNHPLLVKNKGYIGAENIKAGNYLGIPINNIEEEYEFEYELKDNQYSSKIIKDSLNDKREWYLMGYFLGDGWLRRDRGSVLLSINDDEFEKINEKIDNIVPLSKLKKSGQNCHKYEFRQKRWEVIFDKFGIGAKGKMIPSFIFNGKKELVKSFIDGYEDADGCVTSGGISITTISDNIALGIQRLYAKIQKKASLYYQNRSEKTLIEGREVNQNNTYSINTYKNKNKSKNYILDENILWVKVNSIKKKNFDGTVYNISVLNNHTYTANNLINHNCHYSFQFYTKKIRLKERIELLFSGKCNISKDANYSLMSPTHDLIDKYSNVPKRKISMIENIRSNDLPLGNPFNVASKGILLHLVANQVNMLPDELIVNIGDAHIYQNQVEGVKEQLSREIKYELPQIEITGDYDLKDPKKTPLLSQIKLVDYESDDTIHFPLSN